ncbi:MAG: hypothetical protein JG775_1388 [Defluviitaleaceae bacterium]|nr:hypothetical protein [Defluviitaleaceae bacterium]
MFRKYRIFSCQAGFYSTYKELKLENSWKKQKKQKGFYSTYKELKLRSNT